MAPLHTLQQHYKGPLLNKMFWYGDGDEGGGDEVTCQVGRWVGVWHIIDLNKYVIKEN